MNLADRFIARITRRPADFVIGGSERPYLRRWFVIPRNPFFNVYLHQFLRSDDDRALHDHPWANCSILLRGQYIEHTIAQGGVQHETLLRAGDWRLRLSGRMAHRIELLHGTVYEGGGNYRLVDGGPMPCWTLFITGPRYRSWGFHCPEQGWIDWKRFTAADDPGAVGKGCDA